MTELSQIMGYIADYTGGASNFKRGVLCDPSIQDEIRVTVIATGFSIHSLPPIAVYGNDTEKEKAKKVSVYLDGESAQNEHEDPLPGLVVSPAALGNGDFKVTNNPRVFQVEPVAVPAPAVLNKKPVLILEPNQNIAELEQIPAYKRRQSGHTMTNPSEIAKPSPNKVEEKNGQQWLSADNAYIHQTQD